jgi:prepilin peptidase CpaA
MSSLILEAAMSSMLLLLAVLVFPVIMAYAAASDLMTMTIPNWISGVLCAAFVVAAPCSGLSLAEIGLHAAIGALVLAVAFGLFAMNWIGGGDAKLIAAIALWTGPAASLPFVLSAVLAGGLLSIVMIIFRKFPLPVIAMRSDWVVRLHSPEEGIPYGIALAAGGLLTFPATPWFAPLARFAG